MKAGFFLSLIISLSTCALGQTEETVTLRGKIVDSKTGAPVNAEVDIFFDSDFIIDDVQVAHDGLYEEKLKHFGWYIIDISAPGYLHVLDTLWIIDQRRPLIEKYHSLTPLEVGLTVVLNNLYFYFGKTELKPDSYPSLNQVSDFFKANPQITFEIAGHTDDEGDSTYNMMLSEGRAKAVVDYFVKQGIDSTRLIGRGYGENKPLDTGITKAAKARNRRVEFVVLDVGVESRN